MNKPVYLGRFENLIFEFRGIKVMPDSDLAAIQINIEIMRAFAPLQGYYPGEHGIA